jgi:hypothetical protein
MQRNFSQLTAFFVINLVTIMTFLTTVNAQKSPHIDLSLIVGEWSEKGKCSSNRYVFTKNGKYQEFYKERRKSKLFLHGNYTRISSNSLSIVQGNGYEALLEISSLNSKALLGKLLIDEEGISAVYWQRCSTRQ